MDSNYSFVTCIRKIAHAFKRLIICIYYYRFPPELTYYDFVEVAKDLSRQLRDPNGPHHVDLVIALTHMRVPNDIKLARSCKEEIDIILGG